MCAEPQRTVRPVCVCDLCLTSRRNKTTVHKRIMRSQGAADKLEDTREQEAPESVDPEDVLDLTKTLVSGG